MTVAHPSSGLVQTALFELRKAKALAENRLFELGELKAQIALAERLLEELADDLTNKED
jgi:hypothetical protein